LHWLLDTLSRRSLSVTDSISLGRISTHPWRLPPHEHAHNL
jgi:hypothetical protein